METEYLIKTILENFDDDEVLSRFSNIGLTKVNKRATAINNFDDLFSEEENKAFFLDVTAPAFEEFKESALQFGLSEDEIKNQLYPRFMQKVGQQIHQVAYMKLCILTNWKLFGKKNFYFSEQLTSQLAFTEMNAPSVLLNLPFQSVQFIYQCDIAKTLFAKALGYIGKINNSPLCVSATELSGKSGNKILFACFQGKDALLKREIHIESGDVESALNTDWDELGDISKNNYLKSVSSDNESILPFIRLLLNSILYLNTSEPDIIKTLAPYKALEERLTKVVKAKKRKEIRKILNNTSKTDANVVGSLIRVNKSFSNRMNEHIQSNVKIKSSFMVRGHWRKQPHGKSKKKYKLIWIVPYLKGDIAQVINKEYIVS